MTRHTKRLIALASMVVALLGTLLVAPTAAMASTAGSGPGSGPGSGQGFGPGPGPGPITIVCPPPLLRGKPIKVRALRRLLRKHPGRPIQINISIKCSRVVFRPFPVTQACRLRPLVFDATSGSSTLTEVSGPTLAPAQEFMYAGNIYTIMTVDPGADSFTAFLDNVLFVSGSTITNGHGTLLCSPVAGH
jgi:hypothetical protein